MKKYGNEYDRSADFQSNEKYDELLSLIDGEAYVFLDSDIAQCIIKYSKTSIVDKEEINTIVKDRIDNQNLYEIHNNLQCITDKHHFNMSYKITQYVEDLWEIIQANTANIIANHAYLNLVNFIYYIEELEKLDAKNKSKYHDFAVNRILKFLDDNQISSIDNSFDGNNTVMSFDNQIQNHCDTKKLTEEQQSIDSKDKIIKLMSGSRKSSGWGNEEDLLAQINEEVIEKYILEYQEFLCEADTFLRWSGNFNDKPFEQYRKSLINVLEKLKKSTNKDHQYKIQKLLET